MRLSPIPKHADLCIEMPENRLVFENVASMLYTALWEQYERLGYRLVTKRSASHVLRVKIKNIVTGHKFLSSDLLTYGIRKRVVLEAVLSAFRDGVLASKIFTFSVFVPKAKDHVLNSSFVDFENKNLFERAAYKVEQYFRSHINESGGCEVKGISATGKK